MRQVTAVFCLLVAFGGVLSFPVNCKNRHKVIQLDFVESEWSSLLKELRKVDLGKPPYRFVREQSDCTADMRMLTPFAQAAEIVQSRDATGTPTTYADVRGVLESRETVLRVRMFSSRVVFQTKIHMMMLLRGGERVIQPTKEENEQGYQASQAGFYFVNITALFNSDTILAEDAKTVTSLKDKIVVMYAPGFQIDVPFSLADLR